MKGQRNQDGKKKAILLVGCIYSSRLRANLWEDSRDNFGERGKGHLGDKGRVSEGHTGVMDGERQKAPSMQRRLQIRVERKATQMTSRGPMGENSLKGKQLRPAC